MNFPLDVVPISFLQKNPFYSEEGFDIVAEVLVGIYLPWQLWAIIIGIFKLTIKISNLMIL